MPETPTTQQQRDRERLIRFLTHVKSEADRLAEKNGFPDWPKYAWWRMITDAPAGTEIGVANPTSELKYLLHLNMHLDAMWSALKEGRTEAALMQMYDVGRLMELVGIGPFLEGRKKAGKKRLGKTKVDDPTVVLRAYREHRRKYPEQSKTKAKERIAKRYGINRRTIDNYLKKSR